MNDLRDPLVPPDVDLKSYPKMPLAFRRLFGSDTWILGTPEERCAALALWCESWHQVPAGSLPDDDRVLAVLAQAGQRWKRIKSHAMRGWLKCSDGRWYHPVVAEYAVEAWQSKMLASSKGKAGARTRWGRGNAPATSELWPEHSNRTEEKGKEGSSESPPPPFVLPGWVPREAWAAFCEMRERIKKPLTDRAKDLIVAKLATMSGPTGGLAGEILNQSTRNSWQDVYELKARRGSVAGERAERNADVARRLGGGS